MKDCNYCDLNKVIFKTKNGRVSYCSKTKHYEIELASMLVFFDKKEFSYFCSFVSLLDLEKPERYVHLPSGKIIVQPALNSGFYVFYIDELYELRNLLEGALSMLSIEDEINKILSTKK